MRRTSLQVGSIIRELLMAEAALTKKVSRIYPIVAQEGKLPYIAYTRTSFEQNPTKSTFERKGADTIQVEVACFAATYEESLQIAELVRSTLDGAKTPEMRLCYLSSAEEYATADAFVQNLVFTIKI